MLNHVYLATLTVSRVIFHDLPTKRKGMEAAPVLSEIDSPIDEAIVDHLRRSLTKSLGSRHAFDIRFRQAPLSVVPNLIRGFAGRNCTAEEFVALSQDFARAVHQLQTGAISPGLLAVMDGCSNGLHAIGILKLEREVGARLNMSTIDGKRTFEMAVLRDLILTENTRLYKTAIFIRTGTGPDDFEASACDSQLSNFSSRDVAQFWLNFLGCEFIEDPRVTTKNFFETVKDYPNERIADAVLKADFYDHLFSELKTERDRVVPLDFIEACIPEPHRAPLTQYLVERHVPLTAFQKDISGIVSSLRRRAYLTAQGAIVSVPADKTEIITVKPDSILVSDKLARVDR